jgi:hypothetical protein
MHFEYFLEALTKSEIGGYWVNSKGFQFFLLGKFRIQNSKIIVELNDCHSPHGKILRDNNSGYGEKKRKIGLC